MPTLRSAYNIEQLYEVLQKLAHGLPTFHKVATEDITMSFYCDEKGKPRRITVQHHKKTGKKDRWGNDEVEWWSFTLEHKLYTTSSHAIKIDYGGSEEDKQRIEAYLKEIMGSVKPVPRFSLGKYAGNKA